MALEVREPTQKEMSKLNDKEKKTQNASEQELGIRILPGYFLYDLANSASSP
jgi:hypothetical protein